MNKNDETDLFGKKPWYIDRNGVSFDFQRNENHSDKSSAWCSNEILQTRVHSSHQMMRSLILLLVEFIERYLTRNRHIYIRVFFLFSFHIGKHGKHRNVERSFMSNTKTNAFPLPIGARTHTQQREMSKLAQTAAHSCKMDWLTVLRSRQYWQFGFRYDGQSVYRDHQRVRGGV